MNNQAHIPASQEPRLRIVDGKITVTSLAVSEDFGKRHDLLMRKIRNLECSDEFRFRNFAETQQIVTAGATNRKISVFEMTRDGWTLLVMGFTGPKAMAWKERYISAFNVMESELARKKEERMLLEEKPRDGIDIDALFERWLSGQIGETPSWPEYRSYDFVRFTRDRLGLSSMKRELERLGVDPGDKYLDEIDRFLQQVNYLGYMSHKLTEKLLKLHEDIVRARLIKARVERAIEPDARR